MICVEGGEQDDFTIAIEKKKKKIQKQKIRN